MKLAIDIGGTKAKFGLYGSDQIPTNAPYDEATYKCTDYNDFYQLMTHHLSTKENPAIEYIGIAAAGPVKNHSVKLTNLSWEIDRLQLQQQFKIDRVKILNDLEALAWSIPVLSPNDVTTIKTGTNVPDKNMAIIAPGTGLGEAFITQHPTFSVYATEGGHTGFAPTNIEEIELLKFLLTDHPNICVESICSGMGIPEIYRFVTSQLPIAKLNEAANSIATATDPAQAIATYAFHAEKTCDACRKTIEMFVSILGSEAGNLALKTGSTSGIYLGGGILPKLHPHLNYQLFIERFENKGKMKHLLENIPIHLITNPNAVLMGLLNTAQSTVT